MLRKRQREIHASPTSHCDPNVSSAFNAALTERHHIFFCDYRHEVSTKRYTYKKNIKKKNKVALLNEEHKNTRNFRLILNVTSVKCVDANETNTFSAELVIEMLKMFV